MMSDQDIRSGNVVTSLRKRGISIPSPAILLPTTGILLSEGLLFIGFTWYALWGHLATLILTVLAPLRLDDDVAMFQVFALVPVFRLVNLGMPVFFEFTIYWFPLIYAPLIPAGYVTGRAIDAVELSPGWRPALFALPVAIPLSAFLAAIEYELLSPEALIASWTVGQLALIGVVMIVFVGFTEELLFRGVLQRALTARLGRWPGILLASVIFGFMHSGYRLPEEFVFAGTLGLVFGVVYDRTDSLVLISVMHGLLNVFLFAVFPMRGPPADLLRTLL